MAPLRQQMLEDLQIRGLSERTQEMYVRAVRQLAEHYHTSPEHISEEELWQYFLSLKQIKHYSRSASTIALCGITFFYEYTLKREWTTLTFWATCTLRLPHNALGHDTSYGLRTTTDIALYSGKD